MKTPRLLVLTLSLSPLVPAADAAAGPACPCAAAATPAASASSNPGAQTSFEQDRAAILAMAGEYDVTFQFQETVPVREGYELREPYTSGATEFVEVVEDTGELIRLQHVLVMADPEGGPPRVVKHWRQDWTFQDTQIDRFRGQRRWERVELAEEDVSGRWSQAVYQVDDSPRYEGVGAWEHTGNRSAWRSEETWRPLPRREYTKRDDYHVLVATNRHTITPAGWVHEQDNFKLVLGDDGAPAEVLAHESGLNVYDRVDGVDFSAGRAYWADTRDYWSDVRAMWSDALAKPGGTTVAGTVDDEPVWSKLFAIAGEVREDGAYEAMHRERAEAVVLAAVGSSHPRP